MQKLFLYLSQSKHMIVCAVAITQTTLRQFYKWSNCLWSLLSSSCSYMSLAMLSKDISRYPYLLDNSDSFLSPFLKFETITAQSQSIGIFPSSHAKLNILHSTVMPASPMYLISSGLLSSWPAVFPILNFECSLPFLRCRFLACGFWPVLRMYLLVFLC